MAPTKREAPSEDEPEASKKAKSNYDVSYSSEPKQKHFVALNPADCALDFNIGGNGLLGSALYEQGFAYCWSGARANAGINGGKYCFGCKIVSFQSVDMEDTAPDQQHLCRLGISRGDDAVGNLGETEHSFGYGGTGKFSNAGRFTGYGEKFGVGDTIVCAVNLEEKPFASIGFSKNGKWLGTANKFDAGPMRLAVVDSPIRKLQWESAVFPHVLLKNVGVKLQFSVEDGLVPEEGFKPWDCALEDGNSIMGPAFSDPRVCEVMMMVGLPASGKTTWAEKWVKEHPEKRYVLLGTNLVLDQMKVPGLLRRNNYGERFAHLITRATEIFNTLLSIAANIPRNYILDQTNVYKSARKRKLRPFALFRKITVVVFPSPEDLKVRSMKRLEEMGKEVPAEEVNKMLANYVLPVSKDMRGSDENFDQVMFVELNSEESQGCLDVMKQSLACQSNLNSNNSSPYSSGSPFYNFSPYPSPQYQGALASTTGSWNGSYSSVPPSEFNNYQVPNQVNTCQGAVPVGSARLFSVPYQGNQSSPVPRAVTPYATYSGYSGSYNGLPMGGTGPYQSYGAGEPYSSLNFEGNSTTFGAATNPYGSGIIEPSPVGRAMTSFTDNAPGHFGGTGYTRRPAPQAPRAPTFPPSPSPTFLPSPSPPAYGGPPHGTLDPRPQYRNFPAYTPYPTGYAPPAPRYH